jgi:uncharacterized protein YndB with AHSA1/START domain
VSSTRISRHVNAPRANVYRALLDPRAVATWMVPAGTSSHVHAFDAEGLPRGLSPADNETGWQMSLAKLAALVEGG